MKNSNFEAAIDGREYPDHIYMALRAHLVGGMSKPLARRTYGISCKQEFNLAINATRDEDARLRLAPSVL